mmetsp:Transcript_5972/g.14494  ORF Transcript_5972/g.14494 Transcript_5972/m.14494 type:complete len:203 (-) Transcript_5972:400-1008(-)
MEAVCGQLQPAHLTPSRGVGPAAVRVPEAARAPGAAPRQDRAGGGKLRRGEHGQPIRGAPGVQPLSRVRGLVALRAPPLRAQSGERPHGGPSALCGVQEPTGGDGQPRAGPGGRGAEEGRRRDRQRQLGRAPELPPRQVVPAKARGRVRERDHCRKGAPRVQAVVDFLPFRYLSRFHTGEQLEDDKRASKGSSCWTGADIQK